MLSRRAFINFIGLIGLSAFALLDRPRRSPAEPRETEAERFDREFMAAAQRLREAPQHRRAEVQRQMMAGFRGIYFRQSNRLTQQP